MIIETFVTGSRVLHILYSPIDTLSILTGTIGFEDFLKASLNYMRLKNQAREKLRSEEGYALAVRRMIEPEPVFGDMKNNRGFKRFLLRGLPKVSLEVGWLSLAHNLLKKAAVDAKYKGAKQVQSA